MLFRSFCSFFYIVCPYGDKFSTKVRQPAGITKGRKACLSKINTFIRLFKNFNTSLRLFLSRNGRFSYLFVGWIEVTENPNENEAEEAAKQH